MCADLPRKFLWICFLIDPLVPRKKRPAVSSCASLGKLLCWRCMSCSGPRGLGEQSTGTDIRTAIRMSEKKARCMINGVACSLLWTAQMFRLVCGQLLEEEKVQQVYLNRGSMNRLTHLRNDSKPSCFSTVKGCLDGIPAGSKRPFHLWVQVYFCQRLRSIIIPLFKSKKSTIKTSEDEETAEEEEGS